MAVPCTWSPVAMLSRAVFPPRQVLVIPFDVRVPKVRISTHLAEELCSHRCTAALHSSHCTRHIALVSCHLSHCTITVHPSHCTRHIALVSCHPSHCARHTALVTLHLFHATRHTALVTLHPSHCTRHMSPPIEAIDEQVHNSCRHESTPCTLQDCHSH